MPKLRMVLAALLAMVFYYVCLPQLAFDNFGLWFLLFVGTAGLMFVAVMREAEAEAALRRSRAPSIDKKTALILPALLLAISFSIVVGLFVSSYGLVRASSYQQLLGTEVRKDFKTSLPPIDETNAPLVSYNMAMLAAEKKLSAIMALGSQAEVGRLQKQRIGNELYWVGFLEHRSVFSWNSQGTTPGYVRVSATDASNVELVTEVAGKPLKMRYLALSYFGDNAERKLRFSGYATAGLTDFSPEIDDDGRPFIVATVFDRKVGVSGRDARGVVVLDVQTGESQYYATNDAPAWVDRIQPEAFVREQIEDHLHYVHGWYNPSQKDRLEISGSLDLIYGHDGQAYFYAGLTSIGKDGGLVGFMLVNTRTKEVTRFALVGVTETVAQNAAIGVNPEKGYTATNALPFMVDGDTPAYVLALQDKTGIARGYGIVSLVDFQRVAVADTLPAALRLFQSRSNIDRTSLSPTARSNEVVLKARVARIGTEVRQGNTAYVLVLEGQSAKLFSADINRSEQLAVTREGDHVEVTTLGGTQATLPILAFKNQSLGAATRGTTAPVAVRP